MSIFSLSKSVLVTTDVDNFDKDIKLIPIKFQDEIKLREMACMFVIQDPKRF